MDFSLAVAAIKTKGSEPDRSQQTQSYRQLSPS